MRGGRVLRLYGGPLVRINLVFAGLRLMDGGQGLKDELKYRNDQAARRRVETDKRILG